MSPDRFLKARYLKAGWHGRSLAFIIGMLAALSLAPFHFSYLGVANAFLLLVLLRELDWREAFLRGSAYSLGLYLAGTYWVFISVHEFSHSGIPASIGVLLGLSLFMAVQVGAWWALWACVRSDANWRYMLLFPACWVLGEWMTTWFAGGFPWVLAGYAHLQTPLSGWAPVFGVMGLSFAVSASAGALYCLLRKWRTYSAALMLVLLWGGGALLSQVEWTHPTGQSLRVAVVQANIPLSEKFNDSYNPINRALYWHLLEPLWKQADLIVMPETAIAAVTPDGREFIGKVANKASSEETALISGLSERVDIAGERVRYYNSARGFGVSKGLVRKRKLVPFGEFVPLEKWLRGLIPFFDLPLSSFDAGNTAQDPIWAQTHAMDTFICYEIVYPDLVAQHVSPQSILLTISEDAWFGNSSAPRQHLHMARMRSLENGREMIRGTNRGISAIIDYRGNVRARSAFRERGILLEQVNIRGGNTPFMLWGSLPVLILCGLLFGFFIIYRFAYLYLSPNTR